MKNKIREHYKAKYCSSPVEISEDEIDFIIKQECQCSHCSEDIFDLDDFPKLLIEDDEIMCEQCYSEKYRDTCSICEESYDTKDFTTDYIVISEEDSHETRKKPGIYKILSRPYFYGNILTGFEGIFDNSIELVVDIKINAFKKIDCGDGCREVYSGDICPECISNYVRKDTFIKSDSIPVLLIKNDENDSLFKEYTPEQLHKRRQWAIHKRITLRGLIQKGNENL